MVAIFADCGLIVKFLQIAIPIGKFCGVYFVVNFNYFYDIISECQKLFNMFKRV